MDRELYSRALLFAEQAHRRRQAEQTAAPGEEAGDPHGTKEEEPLSNLSELYRRVKEAGSLSVDFLRLGKRKELPGTAGGAAQLRDRMRGALLGCAVGDALGCGLEFAGYPHPRWVEEYERESGASGSVGLITDDTQMTMWLAESLLARDGLDPEDLVRRFTTERIRGIGTATQEFVYNCRRGLPWEQAGVRSAGNGVAMRSAPVGLFYGRDFTALKLAAGLQALVTHNDPMAIASGILVAYAVARLVGEPSGLLDSLARRIDFCRDLSDVIEGLEAGVEYRTRKDGRTSTLYERVAVDVPEFLRAGATAAQVQEAFWSGAYVLESLPFSLFCFLQSPSDFRKTLLDSTNLGHDSDTTGAMACALSGAYNGASAIPSEYLAELEYRSRLEGLGDQMAARLGR